MKRLAPVCSSFIAVLILLQPAMFSGCVSRIVSRPIPQREVNGGVKIAEGIVYQLPSTWLDITGSYSVIETVVKVTTQDASGKPEVTAKPPTYSVKVDASAWKIDKVVRGNSRLSYSINPQDVLSANVALDGTKNSIEIDPAGWLMSINYSPQDKTLETIKNTIDFAANIASMVTFTPLLAAAPASTETREEKEIAKIPVRTIRSVDEIAAEKTRSVVLDELIEQLNGSPVVMTKKPRTDMVSLRPNLSVSADQFCTTAEVKAAIDSLSSEARPRRPVASIDGVVGRYPGDLQIKLSFGTDIQQSDIVYMGNIRAVEAGGVHRQKLRSYPFTSSRDQLTFNSGTLTKWEYGRESAAEKLSAAGVQTTEALATAMGEVNQARLAKLAAERADIEADAARRKAVIEADAAVESAALALHNAKTQLEAAEAGGNATAIAAAQAAVLNAEKQLSLAKLEAEKARRLAEVGS